MLLNEYLNKKTKRKGNIKKGKKNEKDNQNNEKENKEETMKEMKEKLNNIIIGIIKIEKNKMQTIINSYENVIKDLSNYFGMNNEEEIKECEIFINDEKIDFTYDYYFPYEGEYIIKYLFKKNLNSTNYMFFNCNTLISLDLSNFNTKNVTNMSYMFSDCYSLVSLDLTNFNTQNVTNMDYMFSNCNSLISLDLSNFNTQNVINMIHMFSDCKL